MAMTQNIQKTDKQSNVSKLKFKKNRKVMRSNKPSIGMTSGIGGIVSPTINKNTTKASRMVISRLTLSPDSTGRKNPRNEMTNMRKHGAMRLTT